MWIHTKWLLGHHLPILRGTTKTFNFGSIKPFLFQIQKSFLMFRSYHSLPAQMFVFSKNSSISRRGALYLTLSEILSSKKRHSFAHQHQCMPVYFILVSQTVKRKKTLVKSCQSSRVHRPWPSHTGSSLDSMSISRHQQAQPECTPCVKCHQLAPPISDQINASCCSITP